jgi:hypothetical protein
MISPFAGIFSPDREFNGKTSDFLRYTVNPDVPLMIFDDTVTNRQTRPRSFCLGRVKLLISIAFAVVDTLMSNSRVKKKTNPYKNKRDFISYF